MSDSELCLQEIGKRIMDRRKKLGLTQEALAEKGEVTTQFVFPVFYRIGQFKLRRSKRILAVTDECAV